MFYNADDAGYKKIAENAHFKALVYGEKTSLFEFRLDKGAVVPAHQHPHEQTGYLISGRLRFTAGDDSMEVESGGSWCIQGNLEHGAEALEDSVLIEIFSPVREEYLPK